MLLISPAVVPPLVPPELLHHQWWTWTSAQFPFPKNTQYIFMNTDIFTEVKIFSLPILKLGLKLIPNVTLSWVASLTTTSLTKSWVLIWMLILFTLNIHVLKWSYKHRSKYVYKNMYVSLVLCVFICHAYSFRCVSGDRYKTKANSKKQNQKNLSFPEQWIKELIFKVYWALGNQI